MQVNQYVFKSPYPYQVQVGQPDTTQSSQKESEELVNSSNQSLKEAQAFGNSQTQEVSPTVKSKDTLDVYA